MTTTDTNPTVAAGSTPPAFDLDAACTMALLRVHDFIEARADRDQSDLAALFKFDRQQLDRRMAPLIASHVLRRMASCSWQRIYFRLIELERFGA